MKKQEDIELVVILIDNNSNDDTSKMKDFCAEKNVTFVHNTENRGFSAGNNIGLRLSDDLECDFALIINPDVEIRDTMYVKKCIQVLKSNQDIAVLGTKVINMQGKDQNPMKEVTYLGELFWPLELIKNKTKEGNPYVSNSNVSGYCHKVSGCCFFTNVSLIKKMGFLDENVFLYCEEPILAQQVKRFGYRTYYLSECVAFHMHNELKKGNTLKRLEQFYESRNYYLTEYSGYGRVRLVLLRCSRKLQLQIMRKRFAAK